MSRALYLAVLGTWWLGTIGYLRAQSGATGTISGTVRTVDNGPTNRLLIQAARVRPLPAVLLTASASATGTFQFSAVQPGIYSVCAQDQAAGYIDPCRWQLPGIQVTVAAGKTATASLVLQKAVPLKVHVADSGQLIQDSPQSAMFVAVSDAGHTYPLQKIKQDSSGRDYQIPVPFDHTFRLIVKPLHLSAVDANNKSVDNGQTLTLNFSSTQPPAGATPSLSGGQSSTTLSYTVTGKK